MAYSNDLRARVLALYDDGVGTTPIARQLMVSPAWARRVEQRRDDPPRPAGGSKPRLDAAARAKLDGWVAEQPDATLAELRARAADELKVTVSVGCLVPVQHAAGDEADVQKRSVVAAEQARPDVAAARDASFAETPSDVPPPDVVVMDESYATTQFTRLRGRGRRGERVTEHVPHGHWKRLTILAAMTVAGPLVAAATVASTDGDVFGRFVADLLCPALRPGQVVVTDNLQAHKAAGVRAAIEAAGCRLVFLPPYSPDSSPIEPMWSKVKQALRSAAERTVAGLVEAVGPAVATVTAGDCLGYFEHCGYTLHLK